MARRDRKSRKNQTIELPDGTRVQRRVIFFSSHKSYIGLAYQLGFVKVNGLRYQVCRQLGWTDDERTAPWKTTGEPEAVQVRASGLTADDKAWLDDAVEALLRDEYGPQERWSQWSHQMVMTLEGTTATSVAYNLFENCSRYHVEHKVGREAPEAVANLWGSMDTAWSRKQVTQQVSLSLRRLVTKGRAFTFYGESARCREARVYAHINHKDD
jgi:hypothetical protein